MHTNWIFNYFIMEILISFIEEGFVEMKVDSRKFLAVHSDKNINKLFGSFENES